MMPAMGNGAMDRVRRVEPAERPASPKEETAAGDSGAAGERAGAVRGGCAGLLIGLGASFWLTRLMSSLLFSVSAADPGTLAAMTFLLGVIAMLACYIPARRAVRVDPVNALRCE